MAKKKKAPVLPDAPAETKAARFSRLAGARVTVALKRIGLIGNLAGSGYEYTPEQVAVINKALSDMVEGTMARFNKTGKSAVAKFEV